MTPMNFIQFEMYRAETKQPLFPRNSGVALPLAYPACIMDCFGLLNFSCVKLVDCQVSKPLPASEKIFPEEFRPSHYLVW